VVAFGSIVFAAGLAVAGVATSGAISSSSANRGGGHRLQSGAQDADYVDRRSARRILLTKRCQ
jgi:hypothetical protein